MDALMCTKWGQNGEAKAITKIATMKYKKTIKHNEFYKGSRPNLGGISLKTHYLVTHKMWENIINEKNIYIYIWFPK